MSALEEHARRHLSPGTLRAYAAALAWRAAQGRPPRRGVLHFMAAREPGADPRAVEVLVLGTALGYSSGHVVDLYRPRRRAPAGRVVLYTPEHLWAVVARGQTPTVPLHALRDDFEPLPADLGAMAAYAEQWEREGRRRPTSTTEGFEETNP